MPEAPPVECCARCGAAFTNAAYIAAGRAYCSRACLPEVHNRAHLVPWPHSSAAPTEAEYGARLGRGNG